MRSTRDRVLVSALMACALVGPTSLVRSAEASAAESTTERTAALDSLDSEALRCDGLLPTITDTAVADNVRRSLDGLRKRTRELRTTYDQARYDDTLFSLRVEYQRLRSWAAPLAVPLSSSSVTTASTTSESSALPHIAVTTGASIPISDRVAPSVQSTPDSGFNPAGPFIANHCASCHDEVEKKGGLDLTALTWNPNDSDNVSRWVRIHDRIRAGEMPPKKKARPDPTQQDAYLRNLAATLTASEREHVARDGRALQRRLNAYEYENALRDLLHTPWVQIRSGLPDDGVVQRFNKSGAALDLSHVHLARLMKSADGALRQAIAVQATRPPTTTRRFYAREQKFLTKEYVQSSFNTSPDRQTFPLLGTSTDVEVRERRAPGTVGDADLAKRELEAVGWVSNAFPRWDRTPIPVVGRYRIRYSGYSIWVGPHGTSKSFNSERDKQGKPNASRWYLANIDEVSAGRRAEPIAVYAQGGGANRLLGTFDLTPEPMVHELEVWLSAEESVMPKASRLFQPRASQSTNPFVQRDGAPAVAFRWVEIEGPLYDDTTTAGYRLLFGDLPLTRSSGKDLVVESTQPPVDSERLLRDFLRQAFRRPADETEVQELLRLIRDQLDAGVTFAEAMIAGYTAALVSPGFLVLEENPGELNDHALAARLAFFLWNSPPDAALRALADQGTLHQPEVLRQETERLLSDAKAMRFVEAFLDYWLDLRRLEDTSPSITLYNDYYLDDALTEAALAESRLFFADVLRNDRPACEIVASDFTYLNERLALHYGIPDVRGVAMRRVTLPADSVRGGVLTQASVLKITANGTTTSPVLRGKWITERILGHDIPPPPPVGAVEPDIRGAVTIRQQLEKHRADASCASCHQKMDPPGFALENFDIFGGWREHYRAIAPGKPTVDGFGRNGAPFEFHDGLPVDAAGDLPDGRHFQDVRAFKRLLLADAAQEEQLARNLTQQLITYATGAPVRFADRPTVEAILQRTRASDFGVRHLVHELVQSELFRNK